jgi:predicted nucleic acid-binding protein
LILYQDSASIVKRYLRDERGTAETREAVERATVVATGLIAYAEVRAALARASRESRFTRDQYRQAVAAFDGDWNHFYRLAVSESLVRLAGGLAEEHALRGYDAVHLACAITLRDSVPEDVEVSTWDAALIAAANAEGFAVAHRVEP